MCTPVGKGLRFSFLNLFFTYDLIQQLLNKRFTMKKHIRRRKVSVKCMYRHMHNLKIRLPKEKVVELVMEANLMIAMGVTPKDFQKSLSAWERVREPLDSRDLKFYGMHVV